MNIPRAETLNEATKYLGEFTKHLQYTLNGELHKELHLKCSGSLRLAL